MTEEPVQAQLGNCGSSVSDSAPSEEGDDGAREGERDPDKDEARRPKLALALEKKRAGLSVSSLDSSTSESLLEELLCDIRRSRPASLASTPTFPSSDCETDCARDSGRSEAELKGMGESSDSDEPSPQSSAGSSLARGAKFRSIVSSSLQVRGSCGWFCRIWSTTRTPSVDCW